jgi:hypothetical protein
MRSKNMQLIGTHTISLQSANQSHAYLIVQLPREFRRVLGPPSIE